MELEDPGLTLKSWQKTVFPFLLWLAHFTFRCGVVLVLTCRRWFRKLEAITQHIHLAVVGDPSKCQKWLEPQSKTYCSLSDYVSIQSRAKGMLTKKPCHLALVLNEPCLDLESVARLTVWSWACGILNVSIYDFRGCVKTRSSELVDAIRSYLAEEMRDVSLCLRTHNQNDAVIMNLESRQEMALCNGSRQGRWSLSLVSASDGRDDLAAAAGRIAADVKKGVIDSLESIDVDLVASLLKTNQGMPDPDLMIRFGLTSCNMGFLPWQIRLTEIHDHPSHGDATLRDLFTILCRFSKCEQRFGK